MKNIINKLILAGLIASSLYVPSIANTATSTTITEQVQNVLLPIILFNKDDTNMLTARLTNLQQSAIELGLQNLVIEGKAETIPMNKAMDYNISWETAAAYDDEGNKYTTYIDGDFTSAIIAAPDLETGDSFTTEGDPNELVVAWERLQKLMENPENAEEKEVIVAEVQNDYGGDGTNEDDEIDYEGPEFTESSDPVYTTTADGCDINVDLDQMVAIVQEKALENGVAISECTDTLTRYPIEKKYSTCSDYVDMNNMTVTRQYTLFYTDASTGGEIQIQDCTLDADQTSVIIADSDSCSIRHDYDEGVSYEQAKYTYINSLGVKTELQSCNDTETTYTHETTEDTCTPIVVDGQVFAQTKKRITVNDFYQYITECTPDTESTPVQEEACASPRYTHDFDTGQSYLNKNYFYMEGVTRVEVSSCQQSQDTFEHKQDESVCTAINDDTTRQTIMYAKIYIEDIDTSPDSIYISSCESVSPPIDYVRVGGKWGVDSTEYNVEISGSNSGTYEGSYAGLSSYGWRYTAPYGNSHYCSDGPWESFDGAQDFCGEQTYYINGKLPCLVAELTLPWTTFSPNRTLSSEDSDAIPDVGLLQRSGCGTWAGMYICSGSPLRSAPGYSAICTKSVPTCTVTTLTKNPYYLRGDNSYYYNTSVTEETKYVCGIGSNLDGQIE